MSKTTINGIDVSECPLYDKNTGCYHTFNGECVQDSCVVYKWLLEYKRLQKENEGLKKKQITKNGFICDCEQNAKYKQALEEIRNILCNGRTFYEGYFDTPILSRTDEAIKVINEVLK